LQENPVVSLGTEGTHENSYWREAIQMSILSGQSLLTEKQLKATFENGPQ
jgi:hypothetical protein